MIGYVLRRAVVMAFGFVLAAGTGVVLLPIAALLDPAIREVSFDAALNTVFAFIERAEDGIDHGAEFGDFGALFHTVVVAVCLAPLAVVALIGEVAGQRSWLWHAAGCGLLAAASPWIARAAHGSARAHAASPLELRVAALLFLVGVVMGSIYWLVAARGARSGPGPAGLA